MAYEWDVLNVLNCFGDVAPEYFNVYSKIGASGEPSPETRGI